jgi:hypothetical protein
MEMKMAEHPAWNYWLFDDLGNGRIVSIYEGRSLSEIDIRNEQFDLDEKRWCREFWSASQAAAISFGRDPDKLERADDSLSITGAQDRAKHAELIDHIDRLEQIIKSAQKMESLDDPTFLPERYIKWANSIGVDYPHYVAEELKIVESEVARLKEFRTRADQDNRGDQETRHSDLSDGQTDNDLPECAADLPNPKGRAPQARLEANQTKIIFALLLKTNLKKQNMTPLALELSKIL